MQKFIICRHGEIGNDKRLNDLGVAQIEALAELLRAQVEGKDVSVLTSAAPRAWDSARVLMRTLGLKKVSRVETLWSSDGPYAQDNERALKDIEWFAGRCEVLIVMTHLEYCYDLPQLYSMTHGIKTPTPVTLKRGQARVLDCATGEWTVVAAGE